MRVSRLTAIAARHSDVVLHLVDSASDGRLTTERILGDIDTDPARLSAFLCGPEPMLRDLVRGLRAAGVKGRNVHREYFDWR